MTKHAPKPSGGPVAMAAAVAAMAVSLACGAAPAAAKTMNACAVESDFQKRKLKEGEPVSVTGFLKIESDAQGIGLAILGNEDFSCQVAIEGSDAQLQKAAKCGNGAKATVAGKITEELFVPAVVPASITCE